MEENKAKDIGKMTESRRILGCLVGGAAGDALGYTVEFLKYDAITARFGNRGITEYVLDPVSSKALISDDTQMTLFTAEGLLCGAGNELNSIYRAYKDWYITQTTAFENRPAGNNYKLLSHAELFSRRAPGTTCLSGLAAPKMGTITEPLNLSKGCGGVMRVSPIAFLKCQDPIKLDRLAAQAAAITHGHSLGYMPAALLVHILHKSIYENARNRSLFDIVNESVSEFTAAFSTAPNFNDLLTIVNKAISLSQNKRTDIENIRELGEGWVGEEALAIAIYSALRYSNDFSAGIIAAVNHDGDSDSTGAVTGNILGAYLGNDKIDDKWKINLELYDLIEKTGKRFFGGILELGKMRKIDIEAQKDYGGDTFSLIHGYAERKIYIGKFLDELTYEEKAEIMRIVADHGVKRYGSREELEYSIITDMRLEDLDLTSDEVLNAKGNPFKSEVIKNIIKLILFEGALIGVAVSAKYINLSPALVGTAGHAVTAVVCVSLTQSIMKYFKFKKVKKRVEHTNENLMKLEKEKETAESAENQSKESPVEKNN